jgi:hypothetical protein
LPSEKKSWFDEENDDEGKKIDLIDYEGLL